MVSLRAASRRQILPAPNCDAAANEFRAVLWANTRRIGERPIVGIAIGLHIIGEVRTKECDVGLGEPILPIAENLVP